MSESGEEKKLPPSSKKLRDARKKGQLARSSDLVSAAGTCAAIAFLLIQAGSLEESWSGALLLGDKVHAMPFPAAARQIAGGLAQLAAETVLPFLAAMIGASFMMNMVINRGFIFSLEPMMPKGSHINPVEGLKRIFGLRALIELVKTIVKAAILGSIFLLVILGMWKTLIFLPVCGMSCMGYIAGAEVKMLLGIAAIAFIVGGILDFLIQRALFMRDMRMTETEAKREFKEQEGNPQLKAEFKRLRQEASVEPALGVRQASIIIYGTGVAIGVRYVKGETGVPIIVCRGKNATADRILAQARDEGRPIIEDGPLARRLLKGAKLGGAVPSNFFQAVAKLLYAAGKV